MGDAAVIEGSGIGYDSGGGRFSRACWLSAPTPLLMTAGSSTSLGCEWYDVANGFWAGCMLGYSWALWRAALA